MTSERTGGLLLSEKIFDKKWKSDTEKTKQNNNDNNQDMVIRQDGDVWPLSHDLFQI